MVAVDQTNAAINDAEIIILKVGSALLVDEDSKAINASWLGGIAADIAALKAAGKSVIVVSSGAIALGFQALGIKANGVKANGGGPSTKIEQKQAAAAAGQVVLAHAWMEALAQHDIRTAQILLSPDDTETRRRHLNARATMRTLIGLGAVPVVNENDTVATSEIRFGDNDRLAARVGAMVSADMLVLLSDVDGLYTANPRTDKNATHLPVVTNVTAEIMAMAGEANASYASGGMVTKLEAARIATNAGCNMLICDGRANQPLAALANGGRSTLFHAGASPLAARKQWIAGSLSPKGSVTVDDGAARAVKKGLSLLPAGVVEVTGDFDRGDLITVQNNAGQIIGHGLSAYSASDASVIFGHKSREIEALLGYRGRDEIIHADNLVIVDL